MAASEGVTPASRCWRTPLANPFALPRLGIAVSLRPLAPDPGLGDIAEDIVFGQDEAGDAIDARAGAPGGIERHLGARRSRAPGGLFRRAAHRPEQMPE
jgi:hypothetical protein